MMAALSFQPLNVTQEGTHRIFVGLGWDPNETPTLKDKVGALIGKRQKHHDLDLSCFYFAQNGEALGYVTAEAEHYSNANASIYHSGDDSEGIGDGDDEQISVELSNLPEQVHTLFFKASIKSGHSFDDILNPHIRLCDGYTERSFEDVSLHCENSDTNNDAFLFVCIRRSASAWEYAMLQTYFKNETTASIASFLKHNFLKD